MGGLVVDVAVGVNPAVVGERVHVFGHVIGVAGARRIAHVAQRQTAAAQALADLPIPVGYLTTGRVGFGPVPVVDDDSEDVAERFIQSTGLAHIGEIRGGL